MNIILDLDGTLVSSRRRIHTLFCDLIKDEIPSERFWNLKFKGFSNDEILKYNYNFSDKNINLFLERWMKEIESDMYLNMDEIIPGVIKFLEKHSNKDLYICSARQSINNTIKQLEKLNIYNFLK
jgi:phosphoglycolate phosphatase